MLAQFREPIGADRLLCYIYYFRTSPIFPRNAQFSRIVSIFVDLVTSGIYLIITILPVWLPSGESTR